MTPHANLCMPLAFLDVKAINAGRSVRLKSTTKIMICQKLILKELLIFCPSRTRRVLMRMLVFMLLQTVNKLTTTEFETRN